MSLAVTFSTIPEMFLNLTDRYMHDERPILLRKVEGTYAPIRYAELREMVALFFHGLARLGVTRGDRVAILSENRPEWVITDLATLYHGAMDVPIFPSQTAKQVEFILQDAGASVAVVSNRFQLTKLLKIRGEVKSLKHVIVMNEMEDMPEGVLGFRQVLDSGRSEYQQHPNALREASILVKPEDLCTIIYTSGTTGNPKGVMLTHHNFVSNVVAASQVIHINDADVLLSFLPLCHVFERMAGFYVAMSCGATTAYAESIETVAENMLEVRPTVMVAVPRLFERIYNRIACMVEKDAAAKKKIFYWAVDVGRRFVQAEKHGKAGMLLRSQHALASKLVFSKLQERTGGRIRFFVSGGAALPRELGEFFEAVGMIIIEGYGLTESSPVIAANRLGRHRFGSVGEALPGVEVKIAEDGEILTRGPHVMKGYYNNRKATEEAIDSEGWLHTGDVGMLDEHGYLYITDRKKHLFVSSGGKNIAPQPIENLFAGCEFIDQFVLIGDKRMFLTALIVPDFDALRAYADSHGIPYRDNTELVKHAEIYRLIERTIHGTQKDLANYEKVRRFTLLEQAFSIENGEMTPSLKIRRKAVEERYHDLIEAMYRT
ncbi:MAG: long-chain fatty acid--CoA ligase [Bacteroidetes bacterium]|nr:long-chain fatty acid--CoA ligase [Bacteroidota bacterium]